MEYSNATGKRDIRLSVRMIPSDIHKIHPRAPFDISPTGPGAYPDNLESGVRIAHQHRDGCERKLWLRITMTLSGLWFQES